VTILSAPVARQGGSATLRARTAPATACTIAIGYSGAPTPAGMTSDASGNVSWTWRVSDNAPNGTWPVTVTCAGVSATAQLVVR
jgi:hypothetical protein